MFDVIDTLAWPRRFDTTTMLVPCCNATEA